MDAETGELIDAAVSDPERARRLVARSPELLHARWVHGETPLHFLAIEGYADAVRLLAELGTDVNRINEFGDTALIDVLVLGTTEIAKVLLSFGADPNCVSPTRDHVLHCAVRTGNLELVATLLTAGADPKYETDLGQTFVDVLPKDPDQRRAMTELLEGAASDRGEIGKRDA